MRRSNAGPPKSVAAFCPRPLVALMLALLLPSQMLPAETATNPVAATKPNPAILDPNLRILHLLSRFTFGPTADDIASVRKLGPHAIDQWFDLQLHPDRIPDPQLAARLAEYPAMQLPVDQLIERFPSGAEIRQAANGKRPVPRNGAMAAIYRRHVDLYEEKQAKKAEEKSTPGQTKTADAKSEMAMARGMPATADKDAAGMASTNSTAKPSSAAQAPNGESARPTYSDLQIKTIFGLPPAERVSRIMAMPLEEYEQFRSSLKGPQKTLLTQDLNAGQREMLADFDNPTRAVVEELQDQRLLRDIYSTHQLQEVMTTFWLNHFNVYLHKNEEAPYYLVSYERDVIRPHALGNFESLLVATAQSPAMLQYLDNSSSTGPHSIVASKFEPPMFGKQTKTAPGLNENYARELMELHTLGVNGGYTQADVTEVAKVFTGWTVDKPQQGGGALFDETRHEPGKKTVMGHVIKPNGQKEGLQLLHILATSPATARFISQELAIAFVSDKPSPALVNRMAQVFIGTHGDIPSVLKTMLHSPEFWAPAAYQAKVKTPLEYVVSAARASGAEISDPRPLVNALNQMGMPLYACVPPTGYSAKADAWVSTGALVTRMNFSLTLATNHYGGIKPDWTLTPAQITSPLETEQTLEARLIPAGISERTREAVLDQAQGQGQSQAQALPQVQVFPKSAAAVPVAVSQPDTPAQLASQAAKVAAQNKAQDQQNAQIAGLLLGSPEFQRR